MSTVVETSHIIAFVLIETMPTFSINRLESRGHPKRHIKKRQPQKQLSSVRRQGLEPWTH